MRLLLDTHVAVWAVAASSRLSPHTRSLLEDPAHEIFVSAASVWEIAIKSALARGSGPMPFTAAEAIDHFRAAGFLMLDLRPEHAAAVEQLPPLHADPFDRLLLAQARFEPLLLLTGDAKLLAYGSGLLPESG
jgi:PIN domain nuclease of toxin-antitoxin system